MKTRRVILWGLGGLLGVAALVALTVAAVVLSTGFVVRYATGAATFEEGR